MKKNPCGLRKIAEPSKEQKCLSPEHNPPTHIFLDAGTYEYTCPSCGHTITFTVPLIKTKNKTLNDNYYNDDGTPNHNHWLNKMDCGKTMADYFAFRDNYYAELWRFKKIKM